MITTQTALRNRVRKRLREFFIGPDVCHYSPGSETIWCGGASSHRQSDNLRNPRRSRTWALCVKETNKKVIQT